MRHASRNNEIKKFKVVKESARKSFKANNTTSLEKKVNSFIHQEAEEKISKKNKRVSHRSLIGKPPKR